MAPVAMRREQFGGLAEAKSQPARRLPGMPSWTAVTGGNLSRRSTTPGMKPRRPDAGLRPHLETAGALTRHVERYLGPIDGVLRDTSKRKQHLDLLWVARPFSRRHQFLVTCGMSSRAMNAPDPSCRFAELVLCLPADWPLSEAALRQPAHGWPVSLLHDLARLPADEDSWLYFGHSVESCAPGPSFAPTTRQCATWIAHPREPPDHFTHAHLFGEELTFLAVIPIYVEELALKLTRGPEALVERFAQAGLSEVVDPRRPNLGRWLFGLD
jgi:hypothetical protein